MGRVATFFEPKGRGADVMQCTIEQREIGTELDRDKVGMSLAERAFTEIWYLGMANDLTARYVPELGVVRVGYANAHGEPEDGADYPPDPAVWGAIRDHLHFWAR